MKLLFVNACMRGKESRTHQLCMDYLEKFLRAKKEEDWQIEELDLNSMDIQPLTGAVSYTHLTLPTNSRV